MARLQWWQYQKNGSSIQNEIEKALENIKKKIRIIGSGRTDAVFMQSVNQRIFCDKIENDKNS